MSPIDDQNSPALVVMRMFAAREEGRVVEVLALMDPAVKAHVLADGRTLNGVVELRQFFADEAHGGLRTESRADVIQAHGDLVLVEGRTRAFRGNAISDSQAFWIFEVVGGLIRRIDAFRTRVEAEASLAAHLAPVVDA